MKKLTRREWNKLASSGLAAAAAGPAHNLAGAKKPDSKFKGVQLGAQSYSFRERSLDEAIKAMAEIGLSSCELWQGHVEPRSSARGPEAREELRKWRLTVPLQELHKVRERFKQAGIQLYAYNLSFREDFSDAEMERGFDMAKALGVKVLTASSTVSMAGRIDTFAQKHRIRVGMHNHSRVTDPNEFATPESFAKAMEGRSEYICVNLDIGHFTAGNNDPVEYLRQHHDRIVTLHIKDRKRDQGANVPFGEGDTPIRAVLELLRRNKWPIPANIEYEYKGTDTVAEVKRCLDYCRNILLAERPA